MNKPIAKGQWNEVKGKIKQRWAKLTDDDLTRIEGNFDELLGSLQKSYGYTKEKAQSEFDTFQKDFEPSAEESRPGIDPVIAPDREVDQPQAKTKAS